MKAALQQRLDEARARTKKIEARKDLDRPRREIDWTDVGKSALTGARSGLESTVGGIGDIGAMQKDATHWLLDKAGISARPASRHAVERERENTGERGGLSPEAVDTFAKFTNPLSMMPTTEDVGAFTDKFTGRDDYTRHEATTPQGKNIEGLSNFASGLIGGPENLAKDLSIKAATMAPHLVASGGAKLATLIGPTSKLFSKEMAKLAEDMWNTGKAAGKAEPELLDEIWKATGTDTLAGTTRSKGGHFQQEISDAESRMANPLWGERGDPTTMGGAMEHPLGFEAYPDLMQMPVEGRNYGNRTTQGSYTSGAPGEPGMVGVSTHLAPNEQKSTLLHEGFGHGVQERENWEKGATNKMFGGPEDPAWQVYKDRVKAVNTPMSRGDFYAKGGPGHPGEYDYEDYIKQVKASQKDQGWMSTIDRTIQQDALDTAYRKNAAEAQSRNIQYRQDMTLEERKAQPFHRDFDVPLEEQLVKKRVAEPGAPAFEPPAKVLGPKQQARAAAKLRAHEARSGRDDLSEMMQRDYTPDDPASVSKMNYKTGERMNPEQWHGVGGGVKLNTPFSEMTSTVNPVAGAPPQRMLDPASLQGGVGFATLGDKTRNFGTLTDVNGIPLRTPQPLEGGYRFGDEFPGAAWAGERVPMKKIYDKAAAVSDEGKKRVFGIPVTQGATGGDASRMMTGPLLDLMQQAELTPEARKMLDTAMTAELAGAKGGTRWPGVDEVLKNPDWLNTASMGDRAALAAMMNKSAHANERVPVAALRKAITAPDLLNRPALTTGMSVNEFDLGKGLITDPERIHSSYPVHGAGTSLGRVGAMPYDWMFQTHAATRPPGEDLASAQRTVMTQMPVQDFNQQWLDNLMARIEGARR